MEGRIQKQCFASTRTEARASIQTHFYGSEIWVNVLKGRWHLFPWAVQSSVLIRVKELNPFNSGLDHVRSLRARRRGWI